MQEERPAFLLSPRQAKMRIVEEQQAAEKARLAAERAEEKKKKEERSNILGMSSSEGMSPYPGRNSEERMPSLACKVPICARGVHWWLRFYNF